MSNTLSQIQLEAIFANTVLAEDPNLAPSLLQGQDLYFTQKATCQAVSSATQEIEQFQNNIFPGSSSNAFLPKHAASLGIPNITGAQPTQGSLVVILPMGSPSNPSVDFTIPSGAILTNPVTAIQYMVTQNTPFVMADTFISVSIPFQSVLSGSDTYCIPGTVLTFAAPLVVDTVTITQASVNNDVASGSDTPSNVDISTLVNTYMQNPRGGGSTGDYFHWALLSSSLITFAKIIPAGGALADQNIVYISAFVGSNNPTVNIALAFPISRSATLATVNIMGNYIESVRPVNDNPLYATVSTYAITDNVLINPANPTPAITFTVLLAPGLDLTTIIQGSNGLSMTVAEWLEYQTRFAILSAPYGGTILADGKPYILGDDIITLLKSGLSASAYLQGYLCSLIINVTFVYTDATFPGGIPDIPVPNSDIYFVPASGMLPASLEIIYDLDTSIISIDTI